MTIRTFLNRRVWRVKAAYTAAFALCFLGVLVAWVWPPAVFAVMLGFVAAVGVMVHAYFWGVLCPRCRGNLFMVTGQGGGWSVDRRVRFCPYCGVEFDSELGEAEADRVVRA